MKLDWCPEHKGAKDKTLTCYRLRHENGRPVTDAEAMAEILALRAEILRLRAALIDIAEARGFDNIGKWARNRAREALTPNALLSRPAAGKAGKNETA